MDLPFLTALESAGFFRGLADEQAEALRTTIRQRGWPGVFGDSNRLFHADAEELAEGGISEFIHSLEPFLQMEGVAVPQMSDDHSEDGYSVRIDGKVFVIWDAEEIARDAGGEYGLTWGLATVRGFRLVDDLLQGAQSRERLYAVNGGNDLFAFFLTPELHRIISEHPDAKLSDGPYKPTGDYPAFGQPSD